MVVNNHNNVFQPGVDEESSPQRDPLKRYAAYYLIRIYDVTDPTLVFTDSMC